MARAEGEVGVATVLAIFVVVLSTMYLGVQYAHGGLRQHQPSARERAISGAVWTAINRRRTAHGLQPITSRDRALVLAGDVGGANESGLRTAGAGVVADTPLCRRLTVTVPRTGNDLGGRIATRLASADRSGLLLWRNVYKVGLTLAIRNDSVDAVYRTCRHRRFSP